MAISNFIPEVWSARLLEHLDKAHVYAPLMNRDYEGEIKAWGDTVHINQIGEVSIYDYDGSDLPTPEDPDGTQQNLVIDQAKAFNIRVKDIDNAQTMPKLMDDFIQRAAYNVNDVIDAWMGQLLAASAPAGSTLGTVASAVVPTKTTAYEYLVDLGTLLSEQNVPMLGRWAVVPPFFHALLQKDERFVGHGTAYNQGILQGGLVGSAAGFNIYVSNNAPHGYALTADVAISSSKTYYTVDSKGVYSPVATPKVADIATYYEQQSSQKVLAGSNRAGSYAEQLVTLEATRAEKNFADIVKGLHVYGAKVVQPKALACLICAAS